MSNSRGCVYEFKFWFEISKFYKIANIPEFLVYGLVNDSSYSICEKGDSQNIAKLFAIEFDKMGLKYNLQELEIHMAIVMGLGKHYFNTSQKIEALSEWVYKVLQTTQCRYDFLNKVLKNSYNYILEQICGFSI